MRSLKTSEAAAMLGVSPNTLRAWERRFGFPQPVRTPGKHRLYAYAEIEAVSEALRAGLSISRAVARAREGVDRTQDLLLAALLDYDADAADRAIEAALIVRSVEDAVTLELLPVLDTLTEGEGVDSSAWGFAAVWAAEWLVRVRRYSRRPTGARVILLLADPAGLTADGLHAQVLHLMLVRENVQVLPLPAAMVRDADAMVAAFRPDGVVVAGPLTAAEAQAWGRVVRVVQARDVALLSFGESPPGLGPTVEVLPRDPLRAARSAADIVARSGAVAASAQESAA